MPSPSPTTEPTITVEKGYFYNEATGLAEECPAGDWENGVPGSYSKGTMKATKCIPCKCSTKKVIKGNRKTNKYRTISCDAETGDCTCFGSYTTSDDGKTQCDKLQQFAVSYITAFLSLFFLVYPFMTFVMGRGDLLVPSNGEEDHFENWCGSCWRIMPKRLKSLIRLALKILVLPFLLGEYTAVCACTPMTEAGRCLTVLID